MKRRMVFFQRSHLHTMIAMALLVGACGGPSLTDVSSNQPSPSASSTSAVAVKFDVDTAAHKAGTVEGNGTAIVFDFTRNEKNFVLEVTTLSGAPLVSFAATPDTYIERVQGKNLEIKWSRSLVDTRTKENSAEVIAQTRQASGDESLLGRFAARAEYPLVNALHRALKTSITEATATGPSVLALPGDGEGGGGTGGMCMAECRGEGLPETACVKKCMGTPPYSCRPQDNTANHAACTAGVDAWAVTCILDPVDILQPFLDLGCTLLGLDCPSCDSMADQMRNDCPAATICL